MYEILLQNKENCWGKLEFVERWHFNPLAPKVDTYFLKCEYFINQKYNIMKYMAFCGENNGDCAACLKKIQ